MPNTTWSTRTIPTTTWGARTDQSFILREDGFFLLREDGTKFLREDSYDIATTWTVRPTI